MTGKNIKLKFPIFMLFAYVCAFIFENVPRFVFKEILKADTEGYLWQLPGWPWGVLFWYTLIFSIGYLIYMSKGIKWVLLYGITLGMLAETFIFKKMNIVSFFLFPVFYAGMFYLPFRLMRNYK